MMAACAAPLKTADFKVEFAKGTAAYDAGDFTTAREIWQPLADNYDLAAMRNLGHLYRRGLGVARDAKQARAYYHAAAKRGFAPAQYNLARMYLAGDGIALDSKTGMTWLRRAATLNYAPAQAYLRLMTQKAVLFDGAPNENSTPAP
jgi:TPR repeat protein